MLVRATASPPCLPAYLWVIAQVPQHRIRYSTIQLLLLLSGAAITTTSSSAAGVHKVLEALTKGVHLHTHTLLA